MDKFTLYLNQARNMSEEQLKATYAKARERVLNGKAIDALDHDASLRMLGALKQLMEERKSGQQPTASLDQLAARLARDVGMTFEDAKAWIQERGNPYD